MLFLSLNKHGVKEPAQARANRITGYKTCKIFTACKYWSLITLPIQAISLLCYAGQEEPDNQDVAVHGVVIDWIGIAWEANHSSVDKVPEHEWHYLTRDCERDYPANCQIHIGMDQPATGARAG